MAGEISPLNGQQLSKYMQNCVKLAQENKFTIKNAFDLHMIEHMIAFAREETNENEGMGFSVVSMSLHASAKLYGCRVDAIQQETVRLMCGFGRPKKRGEPVETHAELEGEAATPSKKRRVLSSFIAEEGANENPVAVDFNLGRNLLFDQVHNNHSNALGRLMSHNLLPLETEGVDCEMNLPWWSEKSIPKVTTKLLLGIKKTLPLLKPLEDVDMNVDETIKFPQKYLRLYRPLLMNTEDDFVFDVKAEPKPFDDETLPDIAPVEFDESEAVDSRISVPGDLSMIYEESFKSTGSNFDGPNRFRLRQYNILGDEKRSPGQRGRVRRNKDGAFLPLHDEERLRELDKVSPNDACLMTISPRTMDAWSSEATTYHVETASTSFAELAELFAYPGTPLSQLDGDAAEDEEEGRLFDFNDDADDVPLSPCADDQFAEWEPDAAPVARKFNLSNVYATENFFECPSNVLAPGDPMYETLVAAPGIIADECSLSYRKVAKKLNIRQMKESFWKVLTNDDGSRMMTGSKSFSELYREARKHLSVTNQENISLPIAFVAALIVCNEKHLELTMSENSVDFVLSQAPDPRSDDGSAEG